MDYENRSKEYLLGVRAGTQKVIQILGGVNALGGYVPKELVDFVEELDTQIVMKVAIESANKTLDKP